MIFFFVFFDGFLEALFDRVFLGRLRPKTNGARVVNGLIIGVDAMGEEMVAMILFDHRFFKILLGNLL